MAKRREYLNVVVTTKGGRSFNNPLMLSETHLINTLTKDNAELHVQRFSCNEKSYKAIFGK